MQKVHKILSFRPCVTERWNVKEFWTISQTSATAAHLTMTAVSWIAFRDVPMTTKYILILKTLMPPRFTESLLKKLASTLKNKTVIIVSYVIIITMYKFTSWPHGEWKLHISNEHISHSVFILKANTTKQIVLKQLKVEHESYTCIPWQILHTTMIHVHLLGIKACCYKASNTTPI